MLSIYDYGVIVVYFGFMIAISASFRRSNRNTSDYFRGGGQMLWWMVGATAFMTQFSAWTFTGAASKAYENGALVLGIYFANAAGFFINYLWTAPRLRQMRVVTTLEGIRERWSARNEQFFTWIMLPVGLLISGIGLNGLGVVLASVFGININLTILLAGAVVIFMTTLGGAWATTASDFMQLIILVLLTTVGAFLAIHHIGGVGTFLERMPENAFTWGDISRPEILILWFLALFLKQLLGTNNMSEGYRYLCAKDTPEARKGALLATILFIVGPVLWFIPPMVARAVYPDLSVVPALATLGTRVNDGAYLAISIATMPDGMVGLMVTALFAATMSSMDSGLNKNAGIFIRSFWLTFVRPKATETELLVTSKTVTIVFGILMILSALMFNSMKELSLFDLMMQFGSLVTMPLAVPLLWGMFVKRTPPWSAWTTVLVCLLFSFIVGNLSTWFGPDAYRRLMGFTLPFTAWEQTDAVFVLSVLSNVILGSAWFLGTTFWYSRQPASYHAKVDAFFTKLLTPIDFQKEHGPSTDYSQLHVMGRLCLIYGAFILALAAIPNPSIGRWCFVFIGVAAGGIGLALRRAAVTAKRRESAGLPVV